MNYSKVIRHLFETMGSVIKFNAGVGFIFFLFSFNFWVTYLMFDSKHWFTRFVSF